MQCYNGLPVGAKDCDKSAVELYKLVDSGNSLYNKTAHEEAKKVSSSRLGSELKPGNWERTSTKAQIRPNAYV